MTGAEINMVVSDSLDALAFYEKIFDTKKIEASQFPKGQNEVIFTLYDMRFHMLDENLEFGLKAPGSEMPSMWFNITVPDINETFNKALSLGCVETQGITHMPEFGLTNGSFKDPFGYQWLIHEIHQVMSYEERTKVWEAKGH